MKLKVIYLIFITTFAFANCSDFAGNAPVNDESYAVYSTLLGSGRVIKIDTYKDLYLDKDARPSVEQVLKNVNLILPPEFEKAFEDYKQKNKESVKLTDSFNPKGNTTLIIKDELRSFSEEHKLRFWEAFNERYPGAGGYFEVSRVGFDDEKQHAFVYIARYSGYTDGGGHYVLLKKENGNWKEFKRAMLWAS